MVRQILMVRQNLLVRQIFMGWANPFGEARLPRLTELAISMFPNLLPSSQRRHGNIVLDSGLIQQLSSGSPWQIHVHVGEKFLGGP
jgi:hypothetical protein